MIYDVIILGATFITAGIINKTQKNYLVIEEKTNAGYEFLSALKFEKSNIKPKTKEALSFLEKLEQRGIFTELGVKLYDIAYPFYEYLLNKNVLLGMKIISVKKENDLFIVTTISVSGIKEFKSYSLIDTTVHDLMVKEKWISILVTKTDKSAIDLISKKDFQVLESGLKLDKIVKIKLHLTDDFIEARKKIFDFTNSKEFDGYRLMYSADYFDYYLKDEYDKELGGIKYYPSVRYLNPVLAFDEGIMIGEAL